MSRPATLVIVAILCIVYLSAALSQASVGAFPMHLLPETLVAYGALVVPSSFPDDLWRLFAAPLLHVDMQHLLVNVGLLLFFCVGLRPLTAPGLEREMGSRRLVAVFLLGGLAGSLLGVYSYRHSPTICAGSSGAVLALLCTGLVGGCFAWRGALSALLCMAGLLIFGALYQGDNAAHAGGLLLGAPAGLWFRLSKRRRQKRR